MALYNGGFYIRTNPDRGVGEVFLGAKGAQNKELGNCKHCEQQFAKVLNFHGQWPVAANLSINRVLVG